MGAGRCQLQLTSLSLQWTITVSEQIQKPRALLLSLQLEVFQVIWLILEVSVTLLLPFPFLLPFPLQVSRYHLSEIWA